MPADPVTEELGALGGPVAAEVAARLRASTGEMAELLGALVRIESGTDDPDGLDRMAERLQQMFGEFAPVVRYPIGPGGASHLVATVDGVGCRDAGQVLMLGHYDTVWPRGSIEQMPASLTTDGRVTGPGSFDMKGGLVVLYYALRELQKFGAGPRRPVTVLISCDEEVRSRTSRALISEVAVGARAALVFESPLPGGGLKTARKGALIYRLDVTGRAAHAGIEPEKGASAVEELARQVPVIHALSDSTRGTTVNVGVIRGGTRPNVVAAHAEAEIDVRVTTPAEAERIDSALQGLRPMLSGTRLGIVPDLQRPPMTPTPESRALFDRARSIWAALHLGELTAGATGGASDANLVAALGVPTLDGLGPDGAGAHATHEHVLAGSMPSRAALVAGLLAEI